MGVVIEKIASGIRVDGLEFRNGKCGCTSVQPCCYSWSKVKWKGDKVQFTVKASGPDSTGIFFWGYTVAKDGTTVEVSVEDDRDKKIFSGYYPPALEEFIAKGWEVVAKTGEREDFGIWRCAACRWLYKEKDQNTPFADLPADWKCPVCNVGKDSFEKVA